MQYGNTDKIDVKHNLTLKAWQKLTLKFNFMICLIVTYGKSKEQKAKHLGEGEQ